MDIKSPLFVLLLAVSLGASETEAQTLSGALMVTVKDAQGGVLPGASVRISSSALIGGPEVATTNARGQLRFPALPPGTYTMDIERAGFAPFHESDIRIGVNGTLERTAELGLASVSDSVVVEGAGSRIEARDPGFATRFGPDDIAAMPIRRVSMFDFIRAAPGISATSPSSAVTTTVSAFGSGVNENQWMIDGTNFTCPCNGVARSEPGVDFIQEVQVQSAGASAEFGNMQGAVINVVTRQGGAKMLYDASYFGQTSGLTSQPIVLPLAPPAKGTSGFERGLYRDLTTDLGGPAIRDRLWFFVGYQYLRDYDSQPGVDPQYQRTYEQNKFFGKLTWRLTPNLQLVQSIHDEHWVNPEQPTLAKPYETTLRAHAHVPAITFGNLTHVFSDNTLWDLRVGRFVYSRADDPSTGDRTTPGHMDSATGIYSVAPPVFSTLTLKRLTAKGAVSRYGTPLFGVDHEWKIGGQFERGEHQSPSVVPGGVRFVDNNGLKSQAIASAPSNSGGVSLTSSAFVSDAIRIASRATINAGLRFDHARAVSQTLPALDAEGNETADTIAGLGTMYSWNIWSPRLGATAKLTGDGRTMLRASYGRFSQGVLTGEIGLVHPAASTITTLAYDAATGGYTNVQQVVDPTKSLTVDPGTRSPHTDEYSVGVDREVGRRVAVAAAYVHKSGSDFIGWTDTGGAYQEKDQTVAGVTLPVYLLTSGPASRHYLLTNQANYSMTYNGVVMAVERRRANGWQAFGSYTLSRVSGLQPSSGTNAAGTQVSTVAPPPVPTGVTFGRDPNDLTNAGGRLPNDRPHAFRAMGSVDVRLGITLAANLQYVDGKPWAAAALVVVPQNNQQRVLIEERGSRRLSSQTLLDLRVSKAFTLGGIGRVDVMLDVLNALNDTAEETLASEVITASTFGQAVTFIDPRRAMISARLNLGR